MNIPSSRGRLVSAAIVLGALLFASAAQASWEQRHPRRDQILDRTHNLNLRIANERREGELKLWKAHELHAEVRRTRFEQRGMARVNGGYITKAQQAGLNRQENAISREIRP